MKRAIPVFLFLTIAHIVFANGLGGVRLEKVVGDQIVDVGTDQESTPVAGQPIEFDFNLLNSETRDPVNYATSVGINISQNGKMMVNCDIVPELPTTFLFYTFPEGGNYTMTVTFFDKNRDRQELATASFPLVISGSSNKTRLLYIAALFLSIMIGVLGFYWGVRRRTTAQV